MPAAFYNFLIISNSLVLLLVVVSCGRIVIKHQQAGRQAGRRAQAKPNLMEWKSVLHFHPKAKFYAGSIAHNANNYVVNNSSGKLGRHVAPPAGLCNKLKLHNYLLVHVNISLSWNLEWKKLPQHNGL